ncbi:hypothetical protein Pint_07247 [Pistacia integerrima]|uniref:Uncharacterized protein n=1 Tax=Pistacia integerrima TaxID=434235 RepID=A0ACC0XWX6_9ROSI|nr:hypothetical protein Pint_07247 [Pistacia integerrima]
MKMAILKILTGLNWKRCFCL